MTCTVCLNCGADQSPFAPITMGPLYIPDAMTIYWRGLKVPLTTTKRLIVLALARAAGGVLSRGVLADLAGSDSDDPGNLVAVQLSRIKTAFRQVDSEFDAIESVWGEGIRWRVA